MLVVFDHGQRFLSAFLTFRMNCNHRHYTLWREGYESLLLLRRNHCKYSESQIALSLKARPSSHFSQLYIFHDYFTTPLFIDGLIRSTLRIVLYAVLVSSGEGMQRRAWLQMYWCNSMSWASPRHVLHASRRSFTSITSCHVAAFLPSPTSKLILIHLPTRLPPIEAAPQGIFAKTRQNTVSHETSPLNVSHRYFYCQFYRIHLLPISTCSLKKLHQIPIGKPNLDLKGIHPAS